MENKELFARTISAIRKWKTGFKPIFHAPNLFVRTEKKATLLADDKH
jgi:hypothetical protein